MITDFSRYTQRRNWQLGNYEYDSPLLVGAGELASFKEQIKRAIGQTEFAKLVPDEKRDPEKHREALESVIPQFVSKYTEATNLIICDILLTPKSGSPSVEEAYGMIAGTSNGIVQIAAVTAFFLTLVSNKSQDGLLSLTNGEDTVRSSLVNPSKIIAPNNMKIGTSSRPSRAPGRSKNMRKPSS